MAKLIGVVGYEGEDITVYLARILCSLGKKTAIVDRTEQEMLSVMLDIKDQPEGVEKAREYYGIWISNAGVLVGEYDVIFYLFGYRLEHPKIFECDLLLMITDGVPAHASLLKKLSLCECSRYLMVRNVVLLKHTMEYLVVLAGNEESYYEIPFDEKDIRQRCSLSSYGGCEIKHLSYRMKKALLSFLRFGFPAYSEKEILNVMKKL